MSESHAKCKPVHVCQQPSGRECIEKGCTRQAGTWWGPYWCPEHDKERLDRVSAGFHAIAASLDSNPTDPSPDQQNRAEGGAS